MPASQAPARSAFACSSSTLHPPRPHALPLTHTYLRCIPVFPRRLPFALVYFIALIVQYLVVPLCHLAGRDLQSDFTPFRITLSASNRTFSCAAAKRDFGYQPQVGGRCWEGGWTGGREVGGLASGSVGRAAISVPDASRGSMWAACTHLQSKQLQSAI